MIDDLVVLLLALALTVIARLCSCARSLVHRQELLAFSQFHASGTHKDCTELFSSPRQQTPTPHDG